MQTLVQTALALAAIALSVFSLITYSWLGLSVLLLGNRRSNMTWVGGLGLLSGGLFFLCHGALVGAGVPNAASATDFWWRLSWLPAFVAPALWAAMGVHYAGLAGAWRRLRKPALLLVGGAGVVTALLAIYCWSAIADYGDFIRLLNTALRLRGGQQALAAISPRLPALGLAFVLYISACACLPWASLVARRLLPSSAARGRSRTGEASLLWDAGDAWSRARPALLVASLCMMVAGAVVAIIGVLVLFARHRSALGSVPPTLDLPVPGTLPGHMPLPLVFADLIVQLALAGLGLSIGWAVVRQGVLVERRLPQRGYFSHWRGTALLAGVLATVVAAMAGVESEALPDLLLLVALASAAYALFTWQSYVGHDRLLAQLRPFVGSLGGGHSGWLATDPTEVERAIEALFTSLCRDVLGASHARLWLSAGRLHKTLSYVDPKAPRAVHDAREWSLPVSDERGVVARLVLGPRTDGAGYTSADLEIARACGQRMLDAVGEFAAAQAVASLARQRGLESELSAALPRRVLHDDILPRLHLAMLKLEALRARTPVAAIIAGTPSAPDGEVPTVSAVATAGEGETTTGDLGSVVRELGKVHHDLAALMRSMPTANPRHLEHGIVNAIRSALDGEFRGTFDELDWEATEDACARANRLPVILADLLLGATLEAVRNAGRHARGGDMHRHLSLRVRLEADERYVTVTVADDGVGLQSLPTSDRDESLREAAGDISGVNMRPGTRTGLLTHGALMALVGGTLSVHSEPGAGTTVSIRVPWVTSDDVLPGLDATEPASASLAAQA